MSNQKSLLPGSAGLELFAGLTPSPPSVTEEAVHIEGGLLFEHEEGGAAELSGQDTEGLAIAVFLSEPVEIGLTRWIAQEEADGGLAEGPLDVGVSNLGTGDAQELSVGFPGALDEPALGREVLDGGKAPDMANLIEKGEAQDLADAVDAPEEAEGVGVVDAGQVKDRVFELGDEVVVVVEEREVGPDAGPGGGIIAWRKAVLQEAWAAHPERFVSGEPTPRPLPEAVWINPPILSPQHWRLLSNFTQRVSHWR